MSAELGFQVSQTRLLGDHNERLAARIKELKKQLDRELMEEKRLALKNNMLKREAAAFNQVVEAAAEVQAARLEELAEAQAETTRNARALAALREELEETQAGLDRLEAEANMRRNVAAEGRRVRARGGGLRACDFFFVVWLRRCGARSPLSLCFRASAGVDPVSEHLLSASFISAQELIAFLEQCVEDVECLIAEASGSFHRTPPFLAHCCATTCARSNEDAGVHVTGRSELIPSCCAPSAKHQAELEQDEEAEAKKQRAKDARKKQMEATQAAFDRIAPTLFRGSDTATAAAVAAAALTSQYGRPGSQGAGGGAGPGSRGSVRDHGPVHDPDTLPPWEQEREKAAAMRRPGGQGSVSPPRTVSASTGGDAAAVAPMPPGTADSQRSAGGAAAGRWPPQVPGSAPSGPSGRPGLNSGGGAPASRGASRGGRPGTSSDGQVKPWGSSASATPAGGWPPGSSSRPATAQFMSKVERLQLQKQCAPPTGAALPCTRVVSSLLFCLARAHASAAAARPCLLVLLPLPGASRRSCGSWWSPTASLGRPPRRPRPRRPSWTQGTSLPRRSAPARWAAAARVTRKGTAPATGTPRAPATAGRR